MTTLSTHILDTSLGRPAAGVLVRHEERRDGEWRPVAAGTTDADGRISGWAAESGDHRLIFDTAGYFGPTAFYPEVVVAFRVHDDGHHHVPLLISGFGYSTYRGS
jgi:5-hydroxyisourate hydrolase